MTNNYPPNVLDSFPNVFSLVYSFKTKASSSIDNAHRIRKVDAQSDRLETLDDIRGFNNLEYLDITGFGGKSLEKIDVYFPHLHTLIIVFSHVECILPLVNLHCLRNLDMEHVRLKNLEPLMYMKNLTRLRLEASTKKLVHISNCKNLVTLEISGNITNLDSITSNRLQILKCFSSTLTDINSLEKMTTLTKVWLIGGGFEGCLESIDSLRNNTMLNEIAITHNRVLDIKVLESFPHLKGAHLCNNRITNLHDLTKTPQLVRLYVADNPIEEADICNLNRLMRLTIGSREKTCRVSLSCLPKLKKLAVVKPCSDILNEIKECPSLVNLSIMDCDNMDTSHLSNYSNLEALPKDQIRCMVSKNIKALIYADPTGKGLVDRLPSPL